MSTNLQMLYIFILSYGCKLRNLTYFGLFHRFQKLASDLTSLSECQIPFLIHLENKVCNERNVWSVFMYQNACGWQSDTQMSVKC